MTPKVTSGVSAALHTSSDVLNLPSNKDDVKMSLYDLFQSIKAGVYPPMPERYSYKLKLLIESIIKTNPIERLDIDQIVKICDMHKASESK